MYEDLKGSLFFYKYLVTKSKANLIVLSISILMCSCAKMEIVEINKDEKTRTIKFTKKNGKIKLINQKLH